MKIPENKFNKLITAILLVIFSVMTGILGFMFVEDYSFSEAFYMTIITVSTVGFGELKPLTENGRMFVSFYIVFNLSIFAYFLSVTSKFLFEGELINLYQSFLSSREMNALKNHVIVCGCGRNGHRACLEMMKEGVDFIVIDMSRDTLETRFGDKFSTINFLIGDATQEETLKKAGIDRAKALIAAVPQDATNVFIALTARDLNSKIKIIARAMNQSTESKLKRAGANYVVMPDNIGGHYMYLMVNKPHVVDFLDMMNGIGDIKLELEEIGYYEFKEEFRNKSVKDLDVRTISRVTFIGYKNKETGFEFNPNSSVYLNEGEFFIVLGTHEDLKQFKEHFTLKPKTNRV